MDPLKALETLSSSIEFEPMEYSTLCDPGAEIGMRASNRASPVVTFATLMPFPAGNKPRVSTVFTSPSWIFVQDIIK